MKSKRVAAFLFILFVCLSNTYAESNNLTEAQKTQMRLVVSNYCQKTEYFCNATDQDQDNLVKMFSGKFTKQVLNDISDNMEYTGIAQYLLAVSANNIKISFKEDINQLEVIGYLQPNSSNSNSSGNLFAVIIVTKKISSQFINKEVKNKIVINVLDKKIYGILNANPASIPETPIELWLKGIEEFDFAKQYDPRSYKKAREWFQKSAEKGFAEAQNDLGIMYYVGYGGSQNCEEAIKWFTLSDAQGNAQGSRMLGTLYYTGGCIKKDNKKAITYLLKASNDRYALYLLGVMFANGEGVKKNTQRAIQLFEQSKELYIPSGTFDDDYVLQGQMDTFIEELKNQ
jgi:hypothetical protein